jgi:hypothetical protein
MKTNPLLEELWQVKDDLARETGYDLDRIFAELRAAEARQPGPLIGSAEELRSYAAEQEHRHEAPLALKEEAQPPSPDRKQ